MLTWMQATTDLLWRNALVLVPMAVVVLILCRFIPNRPATRHSLWLCLVVWLVAGTLLPPLRLSSRPAAAIRDIDDGSAVTVTQELDFLEAEAAVGLGDVLESPPPTSFEVALTTQWPTCNEAAEPSRETPHEIIRDIMPGREPEPLALAMPRATTPTPPRTVAPVASDSPLISLPASAGVGRLSNKRNRIQYVEPQVEPVIALLSDEPEAAMDEWPSCFPLSLNEALAMHLGPDEQAPRYLYDPSHFQESLTRGTTVLPDREIDATFDNPTLLFGDLKTQGRQWAAALVGIRDAVGRLPAMPLWLWIAGVLLVVATRMRQLIVFRRHILAATTANGAVVRFVEEVSQDIGLRRTPRVVMTNARISPMIWCGRITTLVLPRSLWRELDEAGRRAILYHELAHVRRRDHIVCWFEWIVGALYWWHPLVWWVRSRLSEEAENCCDAWVTWLMPGGRRAYAEALLRTKQFADDSEPVKPAVGIGILTGRAKRFARRLTMVMTQRTAPTGSARSIALIACVSLLGWLATPALSLDEKPAKSETPPTAAAACSGVKIITDATPCAQSGKSSSGGRAKGETAPKVLVATEDGCTISAGTICVETAQTPPVVVGRTGTVYVAPAAGSLKPLRVPTVCVAPSMPAAPTLPAISAWSAMGDNEDDEDLAARLERLERHMELLSEKLEKLSHWQPVTPMPPTAIEDLSAYEDAVKKYNLTAPHAARFPIAGEPDVVRTYSVPEGRLEALVKLMIRDDVPVLVRPIDGGIEVHGPESVQATFKAFVDIITGNRETKTIEYALPKGQLDALQALMIREDVPVLVSPGKGKIGVMGDAATQAVFRNFVEMLNGKMDQSGNSAVSHLHLYENAERAHAGTAAPAMQQRDRAVVREARERARAERHAVAQARREESQYRRQAYRERSKAMEQAIKEMVLHSEQIEREIDRLEREADQVQRKAEEMRMKAEQLRKKLRSSSGPESEKLEAHADEAEAKADALMAHADSILEKADQLEDEATAIEDKVEAMEDELEDIEEESEALDA